MSYRIINLVKYISAFYLAVAILICISWPLEDVFFFENVLFIPSFLFAIFLVIKNRGYYLQFALITLSVFFTLLILELYNNQELIFDHLLYLLRWIKYGVIFILTLCFFRKSNLDQIIICVKGSFLLLAFFNILIYINAFGIGEFLQYLHSPKDTFALSNFHEPGVFRLGGTMMNPNDNGILFGLFFLLFVLHESFKDYYFAIISFLIVLLTQSRTAVLILLGILLIWIIYFIIKTKVSKKQFFLGIFIIITTITFFSVFNFNYISTVFTGKAFQSNSFIIRIENFKSIINSSNDILISGQGVITDQVAVFGKYLDSELTTVIAQFGLIGLFIWLVLIASMIIIAIKKTIHSKVFISFIILYSGTSLTNLSFFNTQLGLLLFVFLGLTFKSKNEINNEANNKT